MAEHSEDDISRIGTTAFSRLCKRMGMALRGRSSLDAKIDSVLGAADNLKAYGFDPIAIDRVAWSINDPAPLSLIDFALTLAADLPLGVVVEDGAPAIYKSRDRILNAQIRLGNLTNSGMATLHKVGPEDGPVEAAGGSRWLAAIAVQPHDSSIVRALCDNGLSMEEARRYLPGHELGHVIFHASGHDDYLGALLDSSPLKDLVEPKVREFIQKAANELFADAVSAVAIRPSAPEQAAIAVSGMYRDQHSRDGETSIYVLSPKFRDPVATFISSWTPSEGTQALAFECMVQSLRRELSVDDDRYARLLAQTALETFQASSKHTEEAMVPAAFHATSKLALRRSDPEPQLGAAHTQAQPFGPAA